MTLTPYGKSIPFGVHGMAGGVRTDLGTLIRPGGNIVAYVNSNGDQASYPPEIRSKLVQTLNAALGYCESGKGDIVVVMPDHAEDISSADQMSNLVAGTQILGLGSGQLRPTFTWTAATATFLLDVANVTLDNLILEMAPAANGGVTVAAPITVSAAGCRISNCRINFGADADDIVGQAINSTAAADDFVFAHNRCFGATAAECETFLNVIGMDRLQVIGNFISGATSAVGVGLIRAETTASLDINIVGNVVQNNLADSEEAITLMNGCTGFMDGNLMGVLDDASVEMDNNGDLVMGNDNYIANVAGERGVQIGTVSA